MIISSLNLPNYTRLTYFGFVNIMSKLMPLSVNLELENIKNIINQIDGETYKT
ncbi:Uncharacterised protein [Candidatus Ornithobacterium hominis]|uniref:Uncharacterized protein n=1 Tax=Candidatus Ornithobacterium hominis TaxID=2497989 RepID=A0A383U2J8_9FLAO|nr:hypothetical protein MSHRCOH1_06935 [Candidatus Ornithobacterium hominis]SZD73496.1 Uncharacterised protein [Candidatus Ornithobacterium hominis]SZD73541.1 Uncharacterised protein [Candidatus Ornithobacterium hominis]